MSNTWYNASGTPGTGQFGSSAAIRSEYLLVQAAFDKLPTLGAGAAGTAVVVNGGGSALSNTSGILNLIGNLTVASLKTLTANSTLTLAGVDSKTLTVNKSLTLDGADGKTLALDNSLTFTGTDGSSVNFGAGGTVLYSVPTITLSGDVTGTTGATVVSAIGGVNVGTPTGTVNVVFSNSPSLVTPTMSSPTISGNALINQQSAKFTDLGSKTGAFNVDLSQTPFYKMTLTGNATPSFINCPNNANYVYQFFILAVQDGVGGHSLTLPGNWPGGSQPSNTTTLNKGDLWAWTTYDGGASYIGSLVAPNITP